MKKLLLLLLFSSCVLLSHAQQSGTSRWTPHADSIFQHINRSLVSTGLLTNYGVALKDYAPFQGTSLSAANQLRGLAEWRLLYGAMQSSIFNGNATLLPLATANQRLAQAQDQQLIFSP